MIKDKIWLLGGYGRVGKSLFDLMQSQEYNVVRSSKDECDFLDYNCAAKYVQKKFKIFPNYIINLMGVPTTISLNDMYPADIANETLTMNMNFLRLCAAQSQQNKIKTIQIISSCGYGQSEILKEQDFLRGEIHPSVKPHGEAKRMLYLLGQFYRKQYEIDVVSIALNSVCGNDTWNNPEQLKVLSSLVKKIVDASHNRDPFVTIWGTGSPRREFIHAKEAAKGILKVLEEYNEPELINIGSGVDYTIREMAECIKKLIGYDGYFHFDTHKIDGQMRKLFDVSKMMNKLDLLLVVPLEIICERLIVEYEDARLDYRS